MVILIVDDDFVSRAKLKALLSEYGACHLAEDGYQALDMFELAHGRSAPYDLITMDIEMPGISGHETVRAIREWEEEHQVYKQGRSVKIMMSTFRQSREDIVSSFREGAEGYLIKPITPDKLAEALAAIGVYKPSPTPSA